MKKKNKHLLFLGMTVALSIAAFSVNVAAEDTENVTSINEDFEVSIADSAMMNENYIEETSGQELQVSVVENDIPENADYLEASIPEEWNEDFEMGLQEETDSLSAKAKMISVTWDANGGKIHKNEYDKNGKLVYYSVFTEDCESDWVDEPSDDEIVRDGYLLVGWTDQFGIKYNYLLQREDGFKPIFTQDMVFKAVWAEAITITYDGNGVSTYIGEDDETGDEIYSTTVEREYIKGEPIYLGVGETFVKEDYGISGWMDPTGKIYKEESEVSIDKDITLKAIWKKRYIIKWNANGGTLIMPEEDPISQIWQYFLEGEYTRKIISATRRGYNFVGWSLSKDKKDIIPVTTETNPYIGNNVITQFEYPARDGLVFYAIWEPQVKQTSISGYTVSIKNQTYNGKALTPAVAVKNKKGTALKKNTDYTVAYSNNVNAGTATVTVTGIGKYTGTIKKNFKINRASIVKATIKGIGNATYTGKKITKSPVVKVGKNTLVSGTDYTIAYKNNINVGKATVTIKAKGNYTGSLTKQFTIKAASIGKATVTGISNQVYTGKAIQPSPTVKLGSTVLKRNKNYTVTYSNNKSIGTATVIIKGIGNYTGTIKKTFKIGPKSTEITKVTGGANKLTVNWKKAAGSLSGYQIQCAKNELFESGVHTKVVNNAKTVSATISGLDSNTTYYVRIRTFKKVGKAIYYSGWNLVKAGTTN